MPWAWRIHYSYNGYWLLWFYPDSQFPVMVSSWEGYSIFFWSWKIEIVSIGSLLGEIRIAVLLNIQRIKQKLQCDIYPRCFKRSSTLLVFSFTFRSFTFLFHSSWDSSYWHHVERGNQAWLFHCGVLCVFFLVRNSKLKMAHSVSSFTTLSLYYGC